MPTGTTNVASGSSLAIKKYSVALFALQNRTPNLTNSLTGPAPQMSAAAAKMKNQTSADMPFVRIQDLSKGQGEVVSMDLFNTTNGKPTVGDANAENTAESLSSSSFEMKINLMTHGTDAGGKMASQRTKVDLPGLAMANEVGWWKRFSDQRTLVHIAGSRGQQVGSDWIVPLQGDASFAEIMVNPVKAPSYNRHFVVDSTGFVQGGAQLASIDATDLFKLSHLDELRFMLDSMTYPMQPVKVPGDPAADDDPMWILLLPAGMYNSLLIDTSTGNNMRYFQAAAQQRAAYGENAKHPLFRGVVGAWNGIYVKKMERFAVQFESGTTTKHITSANAATATETDVTIATLTAGFRVQRGLLLGAQALGIAFGKGASDSDVSTNFYEHRYNLGRAVAYYSDSMTSAAKVRFPYPQSDGSTMPTDHGVMVIDAAARIGTTA